MKELTRISLITSIDFNAIKNISDECFGLNYLTISQIQNAIESKGVFLKVTNGETIIGFSFTFWNFELVNMEVGNMTNTNHLKEDSYGVIKTIAITPNLQKMGYGSQLIEATIEEMKKQYNATMFFYLAWTESKSFSFTSKLTKIGFRTIEIIPNYWYNESLKLNYGCLRCGNPPCNCSLTLFKLTI